MAYHVLLIEQDPEQTELYSDLLREVADCKIDVLSGVENAVDWLSRSNYHLVIIDLPQSKIGTGSSGLDVLEQIKRFSPMTSVIVLSERGTVEQAVAAIKLGAEDYLKKPFNPEAFQLTVKRGLDRKVIFGQDSLMSSFLNLLNSCQMISASLEQEKIFGILQSYLCRELKSDHAGIYMAKGKEVVRAETGTDRAMEEILDIALHASNPLPRMIEAGEFYRFVDRGQLTPALFIFRFQCDTKTDYFCVCLSPEQPEALEPFENRLRMLKAQIEMTSRNIQQYQGVQHLVYVDDATGLYNTRYLHYVLDREIAQSKASGKSFAVLFLDADKFKTINDTHGHLVGTKLLNELGDQLRKFVRESDSVFRYGGDEFVAILSPCDLATAKAVAERIRQAIEKKIFLEDEKLKLRFTVTIGVAIFPDHAGSKKEIIDAADQAMYAGKHRTRNKVSIAGEKEEEKVNG